MAFSLRLSFWACFLLPHPCRALCDGACPERTSKARESNGNLLLRGGPWTNPIGMLTWLLEKFRAADDPEQVARLGDELGRFVFRG
jgi:hypothetical protein